MSEEGSGRSLAVLASRALAWAGQGDLVWGHVAVRDREGRGVWIKAPGWGLDEATESCMQLVSFEAEVLEGEGPPHSECHIHLEILRSRPELHCVVHTHAQSAVSFAALGTPLLPISHDATIFGGLDVPRFPVTGQLVRTPELGRALAQTLSGAPAALLPKHGLVSAGPSAAAAVMYAVLLERACRSQLAAMAAGPVIEYSGLEEAAAKRVECWSESQLLSGWDYLVRRANAVDT